VERTPLDPKRQLDIAGKAMAAFLTLEDRLPREQRAGAKTSGDASEEPEAAPAAIRALESDEGEADGGAEDCVSEATAEGETAGGGAIDKQSSTDNSTTVPGSTRSSEVNFGGDGEEQQRLSRSDGSGATAAMEAPDRAPSGCGSALAAEGLAPLLMQTYGSGGRGVRVERPVFSYR